MDWIQLKEENLNSWHIVFIQIEYKYQQLWFREMIESISNTYNIGLNFQLINFAYYLNLYKRNVSELNL